MTEEAVNTATVDHAALKEKTKAKKRYLKAKKDRRKQRKASRVSVDIDKSQSENIDQEVGVNQDESEDKTMPGESTVVAELLEPTPPADFEERSTKRRKIDNLGFQPEAGGSHKNPDSTTSQNPHSNKRTLPIPSVRDALPYFPSPRRPDAPSKTALALQGLDKALVHAELIELSRSLPISETGCDGTGLSQRMKKRLQDLNISELFAVQTAVIPFLLSDAKQRQLYLPYMPPRDLCVSAPTGGGKTLAYVVPIIEILSSRTVTRLRALIVLPTRDLVLQVRETFEAVGKGRGLKIGTATGQHSFAHEQAQLVADTSSKLQGGSSKVDILICTPGRLMDHLADTHNFSLQHLRFMVIDEADRLLAQSFQDWLSQVLAAIRPPMVPDLADATTVPFSLGIPLADGLSPPCNHIFHGFSHINTDLDEKKEPSCQRLLFSATLTRDPAKLSALHLNNPQYLVVQNSTSDSNREEGIRDLVMEKFTMPASLSEHMVVCDTARKPLILFYLLYKHGVTNALVFTKSAESANRLLRLFQFFEAAWTSPREGGHETRVLQSYSSELSAADRKSILERFKNQDINILVCSDLISRGIDVSHVPHVISYDVPVDMRKYVHRVGRTARAGRAGDAWTLVEEQEARYFKDMLKSADHADTVKRLRISEKDVAPLVQAYQKALDQLKEAYSK